MKRLLVLFAVLVPLTLLIVGCGQGDKDIGQSKVLPVDSKERKERMEKMMRESGPADPKGVPGQGGKK